MSEIEYGDINVQGRRSSLKEGYRRIREEVLKMLERDFTCERDPTRPLTNETHVGFSIKDPERNAEI